MVKEPLVYVVIGKDIVPAIKIGEKGDHLILKTLDDIIEYHQEDVFYHLQSALDRLRENIVAKANVLYALHRGNS